MKDAPSFRIVPEYTGQKTNLEPVARAFVRAVERITGPDGCFKDPALEAEFQEWLKERREKETA
jgi:hypothetical protein